MKRRTDRYSLHIMLAVLLLTALTGSLQAQGVTEYVRIDSLTVGDTFTYSLVVNKDRGYDQVRYPDSTAFGEAFEIRSRQHFKVTDFKDSLAYTVQFFGTEDTRIPALPVTLVADGDTTRAFSSPVPVYFKSLVAEEDTEFRPLKPIFDFARAWWPYLLALLLLGLAGWYGYRRYRLRQEQPEPAPKQVFEPEPFVNPIAQLENTLHQLLSYSFDSEEDFKNFYTLLGDTIRTYFEDLYHIPALESTSREIVYDLERRMVNERMINITRKVLRQADMVKFAKFRPTEEQAKALLADAQEFARVARHHDEPRLEHLRRQHRAEVEQQRKYFEEEQEQATEEPSNKPENA